MQDVIFKKPVDGALFMHKKGCKVFPLRPNGKKPAFKNWQNWATTASEKKIEEFAIANPTHNWGVLCDNLVVIDVDDKDKMKGSDSIELWRNKYGDFDSTFKVRTTTGGKHIYYKGRGRNSTHSLAPGIDTRGVGGYVVAPGSRIGERVYEIISNGGFADTPPFLMEALDTQKAQKEETPKIKSVDSAEHVRQAINYLKTAPICEEGSGERGGEFLLQIFFTVRDLGLSKEMARELVLEHYNDRCEPPWDMSITEDRSHFESKLRNAYKYAQNSNIGAKTAEAEFYTPTTGKEKRAVQATDFDLNNIPKRDWVMKNRFIGSFVSVIVAPGGTGKSALSILDGVSIVTGKPLSGFTVIDRAPVWIYNTEDPLDEMQRRLAAILDYYKIDIDDIEDLHISSGRLWPLNFVKTERHQILINEKLINEVIQYINDNGIKLFIIDPLIGSHECPENDNTAINKVMLVFQRIAEETGCAIALVHHTTKAAHSQSDKADMNVARGAGAIVNAARIIHTVNTMNSEEAKEFGIAEKDRKWYFRFDNAKANLQPPAEQADWFQKVNVKLHNGDSAPTVKKISLAYIKEIKEREAFEAERRDLTNYLINIVEMRDGDEFPVADLYKAIEGDKRMTHIFRDSPHWFRSNILRLFKKKLKSGDLRFSVEEKAGRKSKYYIACKSIKGKQVEEEFLK